MPNVKTKTPFCIAISPLYQIQISVVRTHIQKVNPNLAEIEGAIKRQYLSSARSTVIETLIQYRKKNP